MLSPSPEESLRMSLHSLWSYTIMYGEYRDYRDVYYTIDHISVSDITHVRMREFTDNNA